MHVPDICAEWFFPLPQKNHPVSRKKGGVGRLPRASEWAFCFKQNKSVIWLNGFAGLVGCCLLATLLSIYSKADESKFDSLNSICSLVMFSTLQDQSPRSATESISNSFRLLLRVQHPKPKQRRNIFMKLSFQSVILIDKTPKYSIIKLNKMQCVTIFEVLHC